MARSESTFVGESLCLVITKTGGRPRRLARKGKLVGRGGLRALLVLCLLSFVGQSCRTPQPALAKKPIAAPPSPSASNQITEEVIKGLLRQMDVDPEWITEPTRFAEDHLRQDLEFEISAPISDLTPVFVVSTHYGAPDDTCEEGAIDEQSVWLLLLSESPSGPQLKAHWEGYRPQASVCSTVARILEQGDFNDNGRPEFLVTLEGGRDRDDTKQQYFELLELSGDELAEQLKIAGSEISYSCGGSTFVDVKISYREDQTVIIVTTTSDECGGEEETDEEDGEVAVWSWSIEEESWEERSVH